MAASEAYPKPSRPGGPRLLLGGAPGPKLFAHIAEYADGWMPNSGSGFVLPSPGKLAHFRDLGIEEFVLMLPSGGEHEALRALDDYARYL